jgi:putative PEP-CTERM system TPR-repeat lipoprotein
MRLGGLHAGLGNYEAAVASLKSALVVAPANSTIWVALAAVYTEANKADAGFAEARRLQKDLPTRTAGYALEAELFAAQKKWPEAVAAYRATLAREPLPLAVVRLHGLLLTMGKPEEAASLTQKWLKEHPKDVPVRHYLGQQSLAKGDFKEAAAQYRAAVELEPENPALLNDLAWSLAEIKDAKAIEYAERAYRIAPNNAAVANTYGWVLVQRGDMVQGIQLLRRAVDLDPTDAERRLYLARALIKSGDKSAARKELEIVAKTDSMRVRTQAEQLMKDL